MPGEEIDPIDNTNPPEGTVVDPINPPADPGWLSAVTKDLKEKHGEDMRQHANINPILEDYYSIKDKLAEATFKPKDGATPEEVAKYNETMGIPPNVEGYELDAPPEGLEDANFDGWFKDVALRVGLSKEQAKGQYNEWNKLRSDAVEAKKAEVLETERTMRTEMGSGYDAAVANAEKIIQLGGEDLRTWLNESGAGNDARFVRVFAKIGSMISEDSLGNTHANPQGNPKTLEDRIYPDQGK